MTWKRFLNNYVLIEINNLKNNFMDSSKINKLRRPILNMYRLTLEKHILSEENILDKKILILSAS